MSRIRPWIPLLALVLCGGLAGQNLEAPNSLTLFSSAFKDQGTIPDVFTCRGKNISPALSWTNIPAGTLSLALTCIDPDASSGRWVHWVVYGIQPVMTELPEAQPGQDYIAGGAVQGRTDFGSNAYGGPCPPPGKAHRYVFTLYALDSNPQLQPGLTLDELRAAIRGHVLAEARLTGLFKR
jgi:Raf kinase inhibitor-like YbhB/YbcL family protein